MVSFESDYIMGAHPLILQRLIATNTDFHTGYGADPYCESAKERIREACGCPDAEVEFLVGGTQTNATVISTMLSDSEGVIAVATGHINVHEAGAIEYTGHKVLALPHHNGKLAPDELEDFMASFYADSSYEHMVIPGMVYLSHPTEYGTLYTKEELQKIADICHSYEIPLFLDGARLGYGLMSLQSDMTLSDIAKLCDVFYIGGTKVGALFGEAVVFTRQNRPRHFTTSVKKRGALLAKGWLLGLQFDTLFTDDLYFNISRHAIHMAEELKEIFREKECAFYLESPTNQQFIIVENRQIEELKKQVRFELWEPYDESHTVVRFVTSWATTREDLRAIKELRFCV